jgi:hypothetical protein
MAVRPRCLKDDEKFFQARRSQEYVSTSMRAKVPPFGPGGYLPCGRYQLDMDEAWGLLVGDPGFSRSATRQVLWDGLTSYVLTFEGIQQRYAELLDAHPIIHHLWVGGSFVSTKLDPEDIDLTVFTDAVALEMIKGRSGSGWIKEAFQRDKVRAEYGLEPHQIKYIAVPHVFRPQEMTSLELDYFRDRGRYDDWWQRCHSGDAETKAEPTMDTAVPARGYLEVTL